MAGDLIDSTEMYLRTVLELEEEGIPALRARLAERLHLSAPSISEGVARLEDEGLLRLGSGRIVTLTDEGRELAVHVMRKHRLAERLLSDVLGLEPEYVHEEACRWEHVISDRVEDKLIEFLGNPTTSPYGNPMPGGDDVPDEVVSLADSPDGEVTLYSISELLQSDEEIIHVLHGHGMLAGQTVTVSHDGSAVALAAGDHQVQLDRDSAKLVYVVPA